MTYQIEKLNEARLSDKQQKVYEYVLAGPGSSYKEIAKGTELSLSCVCGRMGELRELGMAWTVRQPKRPKEAHATSDPNDIKRNVYIYEKEEDAKAAKAIKVALNRLAKRGKLHQADIITLKPIVGRITKAV
jgi:predicted transcriptional regulator